MKRAAFAIVAIWALHAPAASAADWYAPECCPFTDCRPAKAGEVRLVAGGYYIKSLDITVRPDDPRVSVSEDDGYHVCLHATARPDLELSHWYNEQNHRILKCLYVPAVS